MQHIPAANTDIKTSTSHIPVMLNDMLVALAPEPNGVYVDGTFGAGGYTRAILDKAPGSTVIAFDRDPDARARYNEMGPSYKNRCTFIDAPFSTMHERLTDMGIKTVNGVVLDLGVSSPQLDCGERGFSFRFDGPLDMRMDPRTGQSAADVLNTANERDIADILYTYGEERKSRSIARAVVQDRTEKPFTTTQDFANLVRRIVKTSPRDTSDPATRSFQALRIYVNRELDELQDALQSAIQIIQKNGRLVVVTFHSLEDRIVKQFMQEKSGTAAGPSRYMPIQKQMDPILKLLNPRGEPASKIEQEQNPRSRSARLRTAIILQSDGDVK
jgi:16S rRNA (cytosine1402-N4)-methyltransferase